MLARGRTPVAGRRAARRRGPPTGIRALVSVARVAGLVLAIASAAGVYWLLSTDDFELDTTSVEVSGLTFTDPGQVSAAVALAAVPGRNVFMVATTAIRRALVALPTIADADVRVVLPHRLVVAIRERQPVLELLHQGRHYFMDADGIVIDERGAAGPAIDLPTIDDQRASLAVSIAVGEPLDATEAAALLRFGALTPATIGSAAFALTVTIYDRDGYVVEAAPYGWRAIFGHYTPTLRPPDTIDRQVQCLRSLLATGEAQIETIYLAPLDDRCGTYEARPTSRPSASPAPPS